MKEFNTTGVCIPSKHYMVDLSERVRKIKKMVDAGKYFTINRARQYGKTTTIDALEKELAPEYLVLSLDFQGISNAGFKSEEAFVKAFSRMLVRKARAVDIPGDIFAALKDYIDRKENDAILDELFGTLSDWCYESKKPIVMMIDEVDSATNNQVFLDFLAQLRLQYLEREKNSVNPAFQSVILAGITDVRNLKRRIRDEDQHKVNSPWNIAAVFDIDMSLSESGIREMLEEYEADHRTGMDTAEMAREIRAYTNGYPFLVSRICQLIDQEICKAQGASHAWTRTGIDEAVKRLLSENNTLFQSISGKLTNYPELKAALRSILMEGARLSYNPDQEDIVQMEMYGLIRNDNGTVKIFNRIFETRLYNLFLSDEELNNSASRRTNCGGRHFQIERDETFLCGT